MHNVACELCRLLTSYLGMDRRRQWESSCFSCSSTRIRPADDARPQLIPRDAHTFPIADSTVAVQGITSNNTLCISYFTAVPWIFHPELPRALWRDRRLLCSPAECCTLDIGVQHPWTDSPGTKAPPRLLVTPSARGQGRWR